MSDRRIPALRHENAGNFNHVMVVAQTLGRWIDADPAVCDVRLRRLLRRVFFSGEIPGGLRPALIVSTRGRGEVPG